MIRELTIFTLATTWVHRERSLLSFPGRRPHAAAIGVGETCATAFSVPHASLGFWEKRLLGAGIPVERTGERFQEEVLSFGDPDGMRLEIVGHHDAGEAKAPRTSDISPEHAIRGFFGVTLCEGGYEKTVGVLATMGFPQDWRARDSLSLCRGGQCAGQSH